MEIKDKKIFLACLFGILAIGLLRAQNDVMLNQNWAMPTLLNPAATGNTDYIRIRGGARLDMLGIHQSPKNFLGTADAPFKVFGKNIGTGIVVNSESYYLYRNLNIGAQGSYKLKIRNSNLSIGIQLGYYHTKFKGSELKLSDLTNPDDENGNDSDITDDPELMPDFGRRVRALEDEEIPGGVTGPYDEPPTQDVAAGVFDIGFGVRYEHPKFYIGISGQHLTNPTLKLTTEGETASDSRYLESKLKASLYFDAGGNIPIHNSLFTLQPSLLFGTDFKDFASVVEMRATYNQKITFGVDYRWNRAAGILAGIFIKDFYVGYSWEYDYKAADKRSTGNHELVLGYQLKLNIGGKNLFSHRSIRIM